MVINEDSAANLRFLIDKGKIDVSIKDQQGFTPLHHLANNNLSAIAISQVKEKQTAPKVRARYIIKKGKKIKV